MKQAQSVVADGMRIDWDVAIPMDDGVVLRAYVFRPLAEGRYPVIMTLGPYAKGLAFQDKFYKGSWDNMVGHYPEIAEGSSNKYQNWEVVDPEKWLPDGYICIRVDSRGAGHSPGVMEVWSPRERKDYHDCIEWAAAQPWSNGKVGLNGISYYAMIQWYVASLQPPHLAAICVWEGAADYYRDLSRHGGILSTFLDTWFNRTLVGRQYGYGERGARSWVTGELVAGPETLPDGVLAKNRVDPGPEVLNRPLDGAYYRERSPKFDKITVPVLSAANWGGMGLHPRGNFEGYRAAASKQKWLQVHGASEALAQAIGRAADGQRRVGLAAADHPSDQLVAIELRDRRSRRGVPAVAEDGDTIADREDLLELVRNVEDRDALAPQAPDRLEERLGLVERDRGGRLVEEQDARVQRQGAGDFDQLLLCRAEALDTVGRPDVETDPLHVRPRLAVDPFPGDPLPRPADDPLEEDVLARGEGRHQAPFLVDDADAVGKCLARTGDIGVAAVDPVG